MIKSDNLNLSDVLHMTDIIKEIDISKYQQETYREIVNEIVYYFLLDKGD